MATNDLLINGALITVLALGAICDLRSRRIPNALTFGGALAGFVANLVVGHLPGALQSASGWGLGVLVLIIPFALRWLGAGDVKFLAAAGAWGGPVYALNTLFFGAIVGGVVAVAIVAAQGYVGDVIRWLVYPLTKRLQLASVSLAGYSQATSGHKASTVSESYTWRRIQFPYGPALAIGGVLAIVLR